MRLALLAAGAEVVVLAPETEQSASSHALSLHRPMRLREVETRHLRPRRHARRLRLRRAARGGCASSRGGRDLVVSGINHGMNLGQDAFYSGTIAAAREGALRGIPALASSATFPAARRRSPSLGARIALELLDATRSAARLGCAAALVSLNVPEAMERAASERRGSARGSTTRWSTSVVTPRPGVPVARRARRPPRARAPERTPTPTTMAPPRSPRSILDMTRTAEAAAMASAGRRARWPKKG